MYFGFSPRNMKRGKRMEKPNRRGILIIEDDDAQAMTLKKLLEKEGYNAKTAKDGEEGLMMARTDQPALIISDVVVAKMDGYELCRQIKSGETTKGTPVILLTQLSEPHDVIRGLESGADNYVTKPFSQDYLLQKIKSLLDGSNFFVNYPKEKCTRFSYGGKEYSLHCGRAQTLNFLLSTYENAVLKNKEMLRSQNELRMLNESLDEEVKERTAALNKEIAERKSAEKALRESEERFRAVVESASDAVICIERPGVVYLWNRKSEEMFGYSAAEALGKNLHDLITPERYRQRANDALAAFFETGTGKFVGKSIVLEALRKGGEEFPIELSISALNMHGVWNSVGIIRDITERKRLEDDLKDKLQDLERMNKLMVGRELKMEELRAQIRELRKKTGENGGKKKEP